MPSPSVTGLVLPSTLGAVQAYDTNGNPIQVAPGASGTVLTSNGTTSVPSFQTAAGGFIQTLTAPVAGNFTQTNYNVGASVVTTQTNLSSPVTAITILQHDPSNTGNFAVLQKAKLAATFTLTVGFTCALAIGTNGVAGLYLSDSAAGPNIIHWTATQPGFGERISLFTNFTTFSSDIVSNVGQTTRYGPIVWMQIQETVANRIYRVSSDGQNFAQVFTEANTAHFTTTKYGIAVATRTASSNAPDSMITMYSFKETTP